MPHAKRMNEQTVKNLRSLCRVGLPCPTLPAKTAAGGDGTPTPTVGNCPFVHGLFTHAFVVDHACVDLTEAMKKRSDGRKYVVLWRIKRQQGGNCHDFI